MLTRLTFDAATRSPESALFKKLLFKIAHALDELDQADCSFALGNTDLRYRKIGILENLELFVLELHC
jgi:hypothetical protein